MMTRSMHGALARQLPRRESLVAQTGAILRAEIARGEYHRRLPGERVLALRLQVSRPTLRAALQGLVREGLIRSQPRLGYAVNAASRPNRTLTTPNIIGFLTASSLALLSPANLLIYQSLERQLHAAGFTVEIRVVGQPVRGTLSQHLELIVRESRAACWLLCSVRKEVQAWFQQRRLPTLVSSTCYPGIHLPWIDVDYRAVCRHAAQTFLGLGHRRIAYLTPRTQFAGDLRSEEGFREAFRQGPGERGEPSVIRHDGTAAGIRRALRSHGRRPPRPTALLVAHSRHALTAASFLIGEGRRLPQDVSLICRDHDEFLSDFTPSLARYEFDGDSCARRFCRALIQLARAGTLKPRQAPLLPHFIRGESVAPPGVGRPISHRDCGGSLA